MGEPIKLITATGESVTTYSRFEAAAMVASGEYAREDGGSDALEAVFSEGDDGLDNMGIVVEVDDFTVVEGISEEIQTALENAGVISWEMVAEWGATRLNKEIAGVGAARAKALVAAAARILG